MKSSLPPLAPNTSSSQKKGHHHNKAVSAHKTPSSNKPFVAGEKAGRGGQAAAVVRKGSYLDDDSVESHKSSFYFEPSITSSSAVALRQPTPPTAQKPSFSPHPPSNRPPAKKEDPIKKLYEDLRRAGRQRPISSGMLNTMQPATPLTTHFVEPKVTIEIASREELAARDLAESSHPSIPTKVEEEGNLQQQQESQADSPADKNLEPQTDPEVACGMIKEGNLSIQYEIRDLLGSCFSVYFQVEVTGQSWTVFVPTTQITTELLRIGKILYPEEEFKRVCYWILSCIHLEFQDQWIIAAHFEQVKFNHMTSAALQHMIEQSCVKIQSFFRMIRAIREVNRLLIAKKKVKHGQMLAKIRARSKNKKTKREEAFLLNSEERLKFAKFTSSFAPTSLPKKVGVPQLPQSPVIRLKKTGTNKEEEEGKNHHKGSHGKDQDKKKKLMDRKKSRFAAGTSGHHTSDRLQESIHGIGEASSNVIYHSRFDTNNQIKNLRKEISGTLSMFEDEIVSLKSELENQKLSYFYGPVRGGVAPNSLMEYNPDDENGGADDGISGPSSRSGIREKSSAQVKEDVEGLKNKLQELELHLALQKSNVQLMEQKAKEDLQKTEEHAAQVIEEAVTKAKIETMEEMQRQLLQKQEELEALEQKFLALEQQKEQELQKEIAAKYKQLEDKLQKEYQEVQQRQEQMKTEMQTMLQTQKEEMEKLQKETTHIEEDLIRKTLQLQQHNERTETRQSDEVFSDGDEMSHFNNHASSTSTKYPVREKNVREGTSTATTKKQTLRDVALAVSAANSMSRRAASKQDINDFEQVNIDGPAIKSPNNANHNKNNKGMVRSNSNVKKEAMLKAPEPVATIPVVSNANDTTNNNSSTANQKPGFFGWLFGGGKKREVSTPDPYQFAPPPQPLAFNFSDNNNAQPTEIEKTYKVPAPITIDDNNDSNQNADMAMDKAPDLGDSPRLTSENLGKLKPSEKRKSIARISFSGINNTDSDANRSERGSRGSPRANHAEPGADYVPPPSPSQSAAAAVAIIGNLLSSSGKFASSSKAPGTASSSKAFSPHNHNHTANNLSPLEETGAVDNEGTEGDEAKPVPDVNEKFARRIQKGTRRWIHNRRCSQNPDMIQPMIEAMLPLVNGTRHEKVISRALLLSIQSRNTELSSKTINRIVELLLKFDKHGTGFQVDLSLIIAVMRIQIQDSFIVNKGFSAMYLMMKNPSNQFETEKYVSDIVDIFLMVFVSYAEDATVCYKLYKCLYRTIECDPTSAIKFANVQIANMLLKGFELHHTRSNVLENILKSVSNLAQECEEGRDVLGQMRIGECILMSLMNHYEAEKLFLLHCRGIMNMCVKNHFMNQEVFSRGIYPNIFVRLLIMYKGKENMMLYLMKTIVAINLNNELVMVKYHSAGLGDVLLDLLTLPGQDVSMIKLCAWTLSNVITYRQLSLRPLYQRTLQILHHCQQHFDGTDVGDEVKKGILRMMRPTARASTPFDGEHYSKDVSTDNKPDPPRKLQSQPSASFNVTSPAPSPNPHGSNVKQFSFNNTRSVKSSPANSVVE